jgi:hypothetical protein
VGNARRTLDHRLPPSSTAILQPEPEALPLDPLHTHFSTSRPVQVAAAWQWWLATPAQAAPSPPLWS